MRSLAHRCSYLTVFEISLDGLTIRRLLGAQTEGFFQRTPRCRKVTKIKQYLIHTKKEIYLSKIIEGDREQGTTQIKASRCR